MGTVLHNVLDNITERWEKKEQTGIMMVDFVKAFDSVSHNFIQQTLKHFNFGPILCGMVKTLLNERRACINLGDMYSGMF